MSDFNLATAAKPILKAYAKNELDLSLTLNMNEDTMRQKIVARCKELGVEPPVAEVETRHEKAQKITKRIKIMIPKSDKHDGEEPVFIGVQGVSYLVPRGIEVKVTPAIVEVLKNAITDNVTQDPDTGEVHHNEVPTYPFNILGEVA